MRTQWNDKIHRGYNGTADTTGRTSRSVVSACGHNGTIKFVCGHNGTADTTGRNTRVDFTLRYPLICNSTQEAIIICPFSFLGSNTTENPPDPSVEWCFMRSWISPYPAGTGR